MCQVKAVENTNKTYTSVGRAKIRSSILIKNEKLFGQFSAILDSEIHGCSQVPLPTQQCILAFLLRPQKMYFLHIFYIFAFQFRMLY